MIFKNLLDYGIDDYFINESKKYENMKVGRVISQYNELYRVVTEHGEMLTEVGCGVAMGNAVDALKEVCDYETKSVDENGIYDACVKLGIIQKKFLSIQL